MRKIILLIVFAVFATLLTAQTKENDTIINFEYIEYKAGDVVNKIAVTKRLAPIFNEWLEEAYNNNVDLSALSKLDGIYFMSFKKYFPKDNSFGVTRFLSGDMQNLITLNTDAIPFYLPSFLEAILYHELYHSMFPLEGHVSCDKENDDVFFLRAGGNINIENVIKKWGCDLKQNYWNYIKELNNKQLNK